MRRSIPALPLLSSLLLTGAAAATVFWPGSFAPDRWAVAAARAEAAAHHRVVALGGVITEIFYAIGAQDRLVGVDTTSLYPVEAMKDKPNVGYVRALSAEGVLSLRPSLIIAIDGAGPPDAMKLIAEAGVPIAHIPDDFSADGVVDRIRRIAALSGAQERGEAVASEAAKGFRALEAARARIAKPKRVLFALSVQNGRVMASGRKTYADAIIGLAGAVNAIDGFDGYKPLTDEAIIAAAPDFILAMDRGDHSIAPDQIFSMPAFATTPAARARGFASMDGLYLLGFGPRTPDAARDLMKAIYGGGQP